MAGLNELLAEMEKLADPDNAKNLSWFFKTGKGEYGEGDVFIGIKVPVQRQLAKKHSDLSLGEIGKLLDSKIHEHRLTGLIILGSRFKKTRDPKIVRFYLSHLKRVNNWDLVDLSAPNILGEYVAENPKEKEILYKLVRSPSLWERRVAIVSTFAFIRRGCLADTMKMAEILLGDDEHLIHKASGWALREAGKHDAKALKSFLNRNAKTMPRTMLRYSIERLSGKERKNYMKK